jgi:hypothetical protein
VSRIVPRYAKINQDVAKPADDIGGCEDGIKGGGRIAGAGEKGVEIRDEWKDRPEWIEAAETTLHRVWTTTYRGQSAAASGVQSSPPPDQQDNDRWLNHWQRKRRAQQQADTRDAIKTFQEEPPLDPEAVTNVIGYWARKRHDHKWKDLAKMALELHIDPRYVC